LSRPSLGTRFSRLPKASQPSREGWTRCRQCGKFTPPTPICAKCGESKELPEKSPPKTKTIAFKGTGADKALWDLIDKIAPGNRSETGEFGQLLLASFLTGKVNLQVAGEDGKVVGMSWEDAAQSVERILKTWYGEDANLHRAVEKELKNIEQLLTERLRREGRPKK